ncbi:MAG TPA: 30S ribosomal protein S30 [Spirochaetia bacterium]|nr:30S ribosomal protein S30 [Spirochaetia bacterium]
MNTEIRGVHYEIMDVDKELIDKKLSRLHFADGDIIDAHFTIVKEKKRFKTEAMIHFRWGHRIFLHVNDFDLHHGIDQLFSKMEVRIGKEKDRVKGR